MSESDPNNIGPTLGNVRVELPPEPEPVPSVDPPVPPTPPEPVPAPPVVETAPATEPVAQPAPPVGDPSGSVELRVEFHPKLYVEPTVVPTQPELVSTPPTEEPVPAPASVSAPLPVDPIIPPLPPEPVLTPPVVETAPASEPVAQPAPVSSPPPVDPPVQPTQSAAAAESVAQPVSVCPVANAQWPIMVLVILMLGLLSLIAWKVFERTPVMATSTASSAQMATAPVSAPAKLERPILGNSAGAEGPHTSAIYRTQEEWLAHSQRMSNTHAEKIAADASAINGENIRGILVDQAEILTRREDVWYDRLDNLRKEQCPPAVPVVSSPPISAPAVDAVTKNDLESVRQSVVGLGTNLDGKIEAVGRSVGDLRQRLDANDGRVNALQEEMRGFQQPKPDPVSQNQTPAVAPNPVPVAPFYVAPNPPVTSGTTPCCGDEKPAPVQQSQAVVAEERYVGVVIFNGDTAVGQPMIVPESSISRVSGQVVSFTVEGESLPTLVPSGFQAVVSRGHATRSDKNASSSVVLQIGKDSMASVFLWKVWDYRRAVYYLNNDGILMKVVSGRASPARISS